MSDPTDLPDAVRRVEMAAMQKGLPIRVVKTATSARTAQEAADAVGTSPAQIVKSLVFRGASSGRAVMILVSGANRVDEARAAGWLGEAVERPDAAFVREATGFAIGGVSPLGASGALPIYMDRTLLGFPAVWAAAGTPFHVFEAVPDSLRSVLDATIVDL
ncbi:YbaK/EbsC family protein [Aureimonas mangrovi]|uniref:YbaK/EbsC family protein n=1 Tax=Aureimonas mangrovi TaxID=2758041 RepID=UPI00163D7546|nr:YbaK/EbsC family protein [Aureimonas mangrovi]